MFNQLQQQQLQQHLQQQQQLLQLQQLLQQSTPQASLPVAIVRGLPQQQPQQQLLNLQGAAPASLLNGSVLQRALLLQQLQGLDQFAMSPATYDSTGLTMPTATLGNLHSYNLAAPNLTAPSLTPPQLATPNLQQFFPQATRQSLLGPPPVGVPIQPSKLVPSGRNAQKQARTASTTPSCKTMPVEDKADPPEGSEDAAETRMDTADQDSPPCPDAAAQEKHTSAPEPESCEVSEPPAKRSKSSEESTEKGHPEQLQAKVQPQARMTAQTQTLELPPEPLEARVPPRFQPRVLQIQDQVRPQNQPQMPPLAAPVQPMLQKQAQTQTSPEHLVPQLEQPQLQKEAEPRKQVQPQLQKEAEPWKQAQPQAHSKPPRQAQPQLQKEAEPRKQSQPQLQKEAQPQKQVQPQLQKEAEPRKQAQPQLQKEAEPWKQAQPQLQMEAEPRKQVQPQAHSKPPRQAQPQLQKEAEPRKQSQPQLQKEAQPQKQVQLQVQPQLQMEAEPWKQVQPQAHSKPPRQAQPQLRKEAQTQTCPQVLAETQPRVQPLEQPLEQPPVQLPVQPSDQTQGQPQPQPQVPASEPAPLPIHSSVLETLPSTVEAGAGREEASLEPVGVQVSTEDSQEELTSGLDVEECERRAREMLRVWGAGGSLKVTILQSSDSRAFSTVSLAPGPRSSDSTPATPAAASAPPTQALQFFCYICKASCCSQQEFQDHMAGAQHQQRLGEIQHMSQACLLSLLPMPRDVLRREDEEPPLRRWCNTCQVYYMGDLIQHRRTQDHKIAKQSLRPFCTVCNRYFKTPRKFVEHVKSQGHKDKAMELKMFEKEIAGQGEDHFITVDAVGCFEDDEDEEDDDNEEEEIEVEEEFCKQVTSKDIPIAEWKDSETYSPNTAYGVDFLVPVMGYVCRICHKFYHGNSGAKLSHCKSLSHFENLQKYKKAKDPSPTARPVSRRCAITARNALTALFTSSGRSHMQPSIQDTAKALSKVTAQPPQPSSTRRSTRLKT
ncbi:cip1-interacting zinc finger protein isoform X2 [Saccopteryx bilineata]|uniref:cip1-interacting zinc finger protein isoform X2 n=1 Tax=Saccopteryx bilineata TaxID=59482 RepID=UPI00338F7D52